MGVPELPELHDAVLNRLLIEWESGTATIALVAVGDGEGQELVLAATGLCEVELERRHPWGPSVHINSARFDSVEGSDEVTLSVEVQSGDQIRVTATAWDIRAGT